MATPEAVTGRERTPSEDGSTDFAEEELARSDSPVPGKSKSKNTEHNTQWIIKMYNRWATEEKMKREKQGSDDKDTIPFGEDLVKESDTSLAHYVALFVRSAKKQNGELYPPRTLQTLLFGINRFMRSRGRYDVNVADEHRPEFAEIRAAMRDRGKEYEDLHEDDGLSVKHVDLITWDHIDTLWRRGILNLTTARGLSRAVLFYNCKVFGIKGTADQKAVRAEHYFFSEDEKGRYVAFKAAEHHIYKTLTSRTNSKKCSPGTDLVKDYEVPGVPQCPYHVFGVYLSLVPPHGPFYRRPSSKSGHMATTFDEMEVGHNSIGCCVRTCMEEAEIPGNFATISACKSIRGEVGIDSLTIPSWLRHPKPAGSSMLRDHLLTETGPAKKRPRTSLPGPVVWHVNGGNGGQPRLLPRPCGSIIRAPVPNVPVSQPVFPDQVGSSASQPPCVLQLVPVPGTVNTGPSAGVQDINHSSHVGGNVMIDVKEEPDDLETNNYGGMSDQKSENIEEINSVRHSDSNHTYPPGFNFDRSLEDNGIIDANIHSKPTGYRDDSVRNPYTLVLEQLKNLESRVKNMEGVHGEESTDSDASTITKQLKALESRVLTMESSASGNSLPPRLENRINRLERRIEETYETLNRKLSETQVTVDKIYAVLLNKF